MHSVLVAHGSGIEPCIAGSGFALQCIAGRWFAHQLVVSWQAAKLAQRAGLEAALAALTAGRSAPSVQRMLDRQASSAAVKGGMAPAGKGKPSFAANSLSSTPPVEADAGHQAVGSGGKASRASDSDAASGPSERRSQPRAVRTGMERAGASASAWDPAGSSPTAQTPPAILAGFAATPLTSVRAAGRGGMQRQGSCAVSPAHSTRGFDPSAAGSLESSPMMLPEPHPAAERRPADLSLSSKVRSACAGRVSGMSRPCVTPSRQRCCPD